MKRMLTAIIASVVAFNDPHNFFLPTPPPRHPSLFVLFTAEIDAFCLWSVFCPTCHYYGFLVPSKKILNKKLKN